MPELPEVEVIRMGLSPQLASRTISHFWYSGKPLRYTVGVEEITQENGSRITDITRRAKYLIFHLHTQKLLIFHLGMTGNLGIFPAESPRQKHDHLEWQLDTGDLLRYHDTRRFGQVALITDTLKQRNIFFRNCGVEPLTEQCSVNYLQHHAVKRHIAIKTFLMTNQIVVGIGNIYANEALFAAKIRPDRSVATITLEEWQRIVYSIKTTLNAAIEYGGSTISDFRNAEQQSGYFQIRFQIYGKAGEICQQCGTTIEKKTIGGRASFFCSVCQQ